MRPFRPMILQQLRNYPCMISYFLQRIGVLLATLLVASLMIFSILEILPGDVAAFMMGVNADAKAVAALRTELGLDAPLPLRYALWLGDMLSGNLGLSYTYRVPVAELLARALTISLPLAAYAFALTLLMAVPLALWLARHTRARSSVAVLGLTQVGVAIPNFWLGLMLLWLFAVKYPVFAAGGFAGWHMGAGPALKSLTLPAVALALPQAAILTRLLRSALVEAMNEEYIRTARAKGLSETAALWRHGLRNALIPVLPIIGLQIAFLMSGTIIIENVFYLQGVGRLLFQAVTQRDLITVRGVTMVVVVIIVLMMFLMDFAAALLDPRRRRSA
jgi:peptide/nickel transport system permease protein